MATGATTITATSGLIFGTAALTVTPAVLVSIGVSPVTASIAAGHTQQFTATGTYSDLSTAESHQLRDVVVVSDRHRHGLELRARHRGGHRGHHHHRHLRAHLRHGRSHRDPGGAREHRRSRP